MADKKATTENTQTEDRKVAEEKNTDLKPRGVVNPKGTAWLREVQLDAAKNAIDRVREQKEQQEFEAAKAQGLTADELTQKAKKDLEKEGK